METELIAQTYDASLHGETVRGWISARGLGRAGGMIFPPLGVVVVDEHGEPMVCAWAHLSVNIGVAFLEDPIARPGLGLASVSAAFKVALGALEAACKALDYSVLVANTPPAIGRWLQNHGFKTLDPRQKITLTKQLSA